LRDAIDAVISNADQVLANQKMNTDGFLVWKRESTAKYCDENGMIFFHLHG